MDYYADGTQNASLLQMEGEMSGGKDQLEEPEEGRKRDISAGGREENPGMGLPRNLFVNRELSWLEFNRRVLCEALDQSVPLLERLKFIAIYASNLDEFFMVRVGSLTDQSIVEPEKPDDKTGMNAAQQIAAVEQAVNSLVPLCQKAYETVCRELKSVGVDIVDYQKISRIEELLALKCFQEEIKPLLSPQIVDRHHPFPFLKNKELYVATSFETKNGEVKLGIVPISHLPPFYTFSVNERKKIVFTADIVLHYAQELYSKYVIQERHVIRVTRNADITIDEGLFDYDVDFRGIMQELLKKRKRLAVVRLQMSHKPSDALRRYFCQKLAVHSGAIMARDIPLDFSFGFSLPRELQLQAKSFFYPERRPSLPIDFSGKGAIRYLSEHDLLLAYPFHSMKPFIDLLYEAADDSSVVSIKITLYRVANHSRIVSALCYAADKGKEVLCVLELRARFDEQNNIDYAKLLEDAGCTVIYGLHDYKVHAKLCLVTRRQHKKISYITQVGTGNYNEKTAELYTDLSFITSNEKVGQDASAVFTSLCMGDTVENTRTLWVAPNQYRNRLLSYIEQETMRQHEAGDGYIGIKANSLNDMQVMEKLVEASRAGVQVELFIRGICCIRPGIRGYTDNLTVKSIVGRYLEHSRIFIFGRGGRREIYIGSGDLLNRNTRRRVEIFIPVTSARAAEDILKIWEAFQRDNVKGWIMQPDGSYSKPEHGGEERLDSQLFLSDYFSRSVQHPIQNPGLGNWIWQGLRRLSHRR